MKMRVGTNAGSAQTEQAIGSQSLKKFVETKKIPRFDTVKKFASEFRIGSTPEYHEEVTKLKESEQVELYGLLERVTVAQILALYATFGMKPFMFGPATLLQDCWKKQSLQQTLCLAILTSGQMHELLEVADFFDALMPEKVPGADRKGVLYYKSQLIELQTIIHASDTIMAHEGDALTPLAVRAYLMNVTPYALAEALTSYVTLEHGYYAAHYYPDVPLDWMMANQQVVSLVSVLNGNAF